MTFLFWILLLVVIYTYFLYPLLLMGLSEILKIPINKDENIRPSVTLIIPAFNEQEYIDAKIENSLSLDYSEDRLKIVVANDGSTDKTADIARGYEPRITVMGFEENQGKTALLNYVLERVDSEIVVFSDTSTFLRKDALKRLVRNFADEKVGCVCGLYRLKSEDNETNARNEGLYWKYETFIKEKESDLYSILGAHGAIYGIRRELFKSLHADVINDDYFIPMQIVRDGHRAIYDPSVLAYEAHIASEEGEFSRRVRISVGNFQQIVAFSDLLHPRHGFFAFEFFSHKVLRPIVPIFLILLFLINMSLRGTFYMIFMHLQVDFYVLAVAGYFLQKKKVSNFLFSVPFYFSMTNLAGFVGMIKFFRRPETADLWKKAE